MLTCDGTVNIPMDAGSGVVLQHEFFVIRDLKHPTILGNTFFSEYSISINWPGPLVRAQGKRVPSLTYDLANKVLIEVDDGHGIVSKDTLIPPASTTWLELQVDETVFR